MAMTSPTHPTRYVSYRSGSFQWRTAESSTWHPYDELEITGPTNIRKHSSYTDQLWYVLDGMDGELTTTSGPTATPSTGRPMLSTAPPQSPSLGRQSTGGTVVNIGNTAIDPGGEGPRDWASRRPDINVVDGSIRDAIKNGRLAGVERLDLPNLPKK